MREIKFRAWDGETMWDVREVEWDAGGISSLYLGLHSQEMNDDIKLMQFTGLKDKNGKEIYEGDVVKYENCTGDEQTAQVEWTTWGTGFEPFTVCGKCGDVPQEESVEIIGNIYENPELLKSNLT